MEGSFVVSFIGFNVFLRNTVSTNDAKGYNGKIFTFEHSWNKYYKNCAKLAIIILSRPIATICSKKINRLRRRRRRRRLEYRNWQKFQPVPNLRRRWNVYCKWVDEKVAFLPFVNPFRDIIEHIKHYKWYCSAGYINSPRFFRVLISVMSFKI